MEMELEIRAGGPEFALGPGDDRLRKGAGVAHAKDSPLSGAVAHGRQQDGMAKRRAGRRRIDRKDISAPG
jgi:hypothetical protein